MIGLLLRTGFPALKAFPICVIPGKIDMVMTLGRRPMINREVVGNTSASSLTAVSPGCMKARTSGHGLELSLCYDFARLVAQPLFDIKLELSFLVSRKNLYHDLRQGSPGQIMASDLT